MKAVIVDEIGAFVIREVEPDPPREGETLWAGRAIGKLQEWVRAQGPGHDGSARLERLLAQADIPA